MFNLKDMMVRIPDWYVPWWWKVAYKIPAPLDDRLGQLIQIKPDERFNTTVTKYLRGVLEKGEMPPADIMPAILNLANDFVDGRELIIRTGDYIAIQNHLRSMK